MVFTCLGVPSKSLPHDKLNKVSPVKIARDPGKYKLIWPESRIKLIREKIKTRDIKDISWMAFVCTTETIKTSIFVGHMHI